ncbi:unnamed protein product [Microthlaspi erraticum]|nr:unnamed protein product [Microthlaspi erraticum]
MNHILFTSLFLTILASFKLILFAFDQGPLFHLPSNLTRFICFTCLPIKLQQNPNSQNLVPKWVFGIKVAIYSLLLNFYCDNHNLPRVLRIGLRPVHMYLEFEIFLALIKFLVTITLGCDLEPQFNEPYLATSLQDFWGRRWNLMVSSNLRFAFHEIIHFYLTRDAPSWELTAYFVLNGVCTVVEMAVKRTKFGMRWQLRPVVSWLLTWGFIVSTGAFLFFDPLQYDRYDIRLT